MGKFVYSSCKNGHVFAGYEENDLLVSLGHKPYPCPECNNKCSTTD